MRQRLRDHYLIIILITLNILFAVVFGSDFNESWDERPRYNSAVEAIETYKNFDISDGVGGKGPFYFITAKLGGDIIQLVNPNLTHFQAWHFIHFLTFILGVIAFYSISLRFLPPNYAFITTALYNTQPVLFGHAFINPKDIPFLSAFLLILASGLIMADKLEGEYEKLNIISDIKLLRKIILDDWSKLKSYQKKMSTLFGGVSFILLYLLIIQDDYIKRLIVKSINQIRLPFLYDLIDKFANSLLNGTISGGISLHNVEKGYSLFVVISGVLIATALIILVVIYFPRMYRFLSGYSSKKQFVTGLISVFRTGWVYPAAIIFGLSINIRSLSISAGVFILFYIWIKKRSSFLPALLIYFGIAFMTFWITWPELWSNPFTGLISSLLSNSRFSWGGRTLFQGVAYKPEDLPFYYLPFLMAIQFTIPVILLSLLGLINYIRDSKKKHFDHVLFFIFSIWFLVPICLAIITKPAIYHNFRHFLFVTPPIFFLSGLGIKSILSRFKHLSITILIILIIITPGIVGIIQLHPYQYIYYNQFVGGVKGAFRSYENDYWATSYQDCVSYINQVAEENAVVLNYGPTGLVENSLRDDLEMERFVIKNYNQNNDVSNYQVSDYIIMPSRMDHDLIFFPDKKIIYSVEVSGAVLCVVKDLKDNY